MPSLFGALLLCGSAAAQPAAEMLKYAIVRKGDQIGTHVVEVRRKDAEVSVKAETQVEVKVAFFTAYQFRQANTEKWVNGRLVSLQANTDDNGTKHKVEVTAGNQGLRIQADGKTATAAPDTIPASVWNRALMRQSTAISLSDGTLAPVKVVDKGEETIVVQGKRVKAHRYFYVSGKFEQDLWYDEQDRLVQLRLTGTDGSDVFYRLL
jgi:hypothetical protein